MRRPTKRQAGLFIALLACLAGALGFAPWVRSAVNERALRYGAAVRVDWVLPRWGGVSLRGVHVSFEKAPALNVELARVDVGLFGESRTVNVSGGQVRIAGDPDAVLQQLRDIKPAATSGEAPAGRGTTIVWSGLRVDAQLGAVEVSAENVGLEREGESFAVRSERVRGSSPWGNLELQGITAKTTRTESGHRLRSFDTQGATVELRPTLALPLSSSGPTEGESPGLVKRLATARKLLDTLDGRLDSALSPDAQVSLAGVRVVWGPPDQRVSLGPASLTLKRQEGRSSFSYEARQGVATTSPALLARLDVPRSDDAISLRVDGGPISLATLGFKDGDLGLVDTDRAELSANGLFSVDAGAEVLSFDGELSGQYLGFASLAVARDPLRNIKASFRGKARLATDRSQFSLQQGEFELGSLRALVDAEVVRTTGSKDPDHYRLKAKYEVPLVPCQTVVDAAPEGLWVVAKGTRVAGSFSLKGHANFDTANLDKTYDVHYDLSSSCRVTEVPPAMNVSRFKAPFRIEVVGRDGNKEAEIDTGPTSRNWVGLGSISPFMPIAVMTCEDGRFMRHEGFDHEAIRNSLRENIRRRKFFRGASTISMQLAKNLYLSKEKRLSRKLEEVLLTMYLEQSLTKEQMIELYLNVVEFGPQVYGVEGAARHYFQTSPSRLSLSQAFFLASILPAPKVEHFGAGGALSRGWLNNLRTLMKHANKRLRLSDDDLQKGLAEIPLRGSPAPMRDPDATPPPEAPIGEDGGVIGEP